MATFLDATLLGYFSGVFTFLLIWIVSYGALELVSPFGDEKNGLNALVSLALAFLVVFMEPARTFVEFVVPWLAVLAVVFFFFSLIFMAMGKDMEFVQDLAENKFYGIIVTIVVVIAIFGLGAAFDNTTTSAEVNRDNNLQTGSTADNYSPNGTQSALEGYRQRNDPGYQGPPQARQGGQQDSQRSSFADKFIYTFTHPKVLGTLFLLALAALTIGNLTKEG